MENYIARYQPTLLFFDNVGTSSGSCNSGQYSYTTSSFTDAYNYTQAVTLTNCETSTPQYTYMANSRFPVSGTYSVVKSGNSSSYTIAITPTLNLTIASASLLSGGIQTITVGQNSTTTVFQNWQMSTNSQTLTGNYTTTYTTTNGATSKNYTSASLLSSVGWTLNFATTTPIQSINTSSWPNSITSGTISVTTPAIQYWFDNVFQRSDYSATACNSTGNGTDSISTQIYYLKTIIVLA